MTAELLHTTTPGVDPDEETATPLKKMKIPFLAGLTVGEFFDKAKRDPSGLGEQLYEHGHVDGEMPSDLYPSFEAARDALVAEWIARDMGLDLLEQTQTSQRVPVLGGLMTWMEENAEAIADRDKDPLGTWALIHGDYGSGKTTQGAAVIQAIHQLAARSIIHEPREYMWHPRFLRALKATRVIYANEADMLESLRPEADEPRTLRFWREATWLILDECGGGRITDWGEEQIYAVLNHRYQRRKPTLLISNHNPGELVKRWRQPRLGSRLVQRLGGLDMPRVFTMRGNHRW